MSDKPKLLVVDDEQVICQACQRILSQQGYQVETQQDAPEALRWATERDYVAVLLDIKMPRMDGIEFLERLREKKADLPVLIITGYPSIPNAAAAIRLGASDYITKPFTPEEITRALHRILARRLPAQEATPEAAEEPSRGEEFLFFDEVWFQLANDGSAAIGAVLPGLRGAAVKEVRLPRIGEVVYQGLPLAALNVAERPPVIIPAPVSGVVGGVNDLLLRDPEAVLRDPCGTGWIACLCTTRVEEEMGRCKPRRVVLVGSSLPKAEEQRQQFAALGCQVRVVINRDNIGSALGERDGLLVLDADSLGAQGPSLVAQINAQARG